MSKYFLARLCDDISRQIRHHGRKHDRHVDGNDFEAVGEAHRLLAGLDEQYYEEGDEEDYENAINDDIDPEQHYRRLIEIVHAFTVAGHSTQDI